MNPELWERVKETFENISDATPEDRARVLASLDEETRHEVERLLASYDDSPAYPGDETGPLPTRALIAALIRDQRAFDDGQVLIDRFEIRRFLGSGGMGEVYEAYDRKLGDVAIKTLRMELTSNKQTIETFQREVMRGRRVAHPNVCKTYEFFEIGDTDDSRIPFLTMELLAGETLTSAVQPTGGMKEPGAQRIALEICSGLGAAHDAGVIHGDLKTGNVLLAEDHGAVRAKITDFGLARLAPWAERQESILPAAIAGTKQYLAPELMSGDSTSVASDIFALGVVLFYMRTARYPFDAGADWATARDERRRPPTFDEMSGELGVRWATAIAACLAADPSRRPENATRVVELLTRDEGRRLFTRRYILSGVGLAAVAAAGVEDWRRATVLDLPPGKLRTLVEDIDTANAPAAVGRAVRSLLSLSLDSSKRIQLIPAADIMTAKQTFGMGGQPLRGGTSLKVAQRTGAQVLVSGSIASEGPLYHVRIWAFEPKSKRELLSAQDARTKPRDVPGTVSGLAATLRKRLGGEAELAQFGAVPLDQADTDRADALEAFTIGLTFHHNGEPEAALEKLAEATRLDPSFCVAFVYLAQVQIVVLRDHLALAPVSRAYELRGRLNAHHKLYIEYLNLYLLGDWAGAHDVLLLLNKFFPDDPNLNRLLSQSFALLQQPGKALEAAARAAELDPDNPLNANQFISGLAETGRQEEANRALRLGLARFPEAPVLLFCQAYLQALDLQSEKAVDALEKLARREKLANLTRYQIAKARMLGGQWVEVLRQLERDILMDQSSNQQMMGDMFRYWCGQVYVVLEDRQGAAAQAEALARREPISVNLAAFRHAAELAWLSGQPDTLAEIIRKLTVIQRIHRSTRSEGVLRMTSALESSMRGEQEQANEEIAMACELWPDLVNNWVSAELLCEQGRYSEAATLFDRVVKARASAIRFDAVNVWVRSLARLAFCLDATGTTSDAAVYWNQFTRLWGPPLKYRFCREAMAVMRA